jgi:hypothetical protein
MPYIVIKEEKGGWGERWEYYALQPPPLAQVINILQNPPRYQSLETKVAICSPAVVHRSRFVCPLTSSSWSPAANPWVESQASVPVGKVHKNLKSKPGSMMRDKRKPPVVLGEPTLD